MAGQDSTFQDILLELMVANETLEKIEKNTASLLPFLTGDGAQAGAAPGAVAKDIESAAEDSPLYACCEKIAQGIGESVAALNYLANYGEMTNTLLVEIRNNLFGLRNDLADSTRAKGLEKLQGMETSAEAKKPVVQVKPPTGPRPAVDVGKVSFGQTAAMLAGMLTGFVTGLIVQVSKMVMSAVKLLTGPFKKLLRVLGSVLGDAFAVVTKLGARVFEAIKDELTLLKRFASFKLGELIQPIIKWFKSVQMAGKMMISAKLGKYLDPLLEAFDLIKAEGKVFTSKVATVAKSLFSSVSSSFAKASASAGEWAKPLKAAFGEFFVEMKAFWKTLTDLRPEKLYRSFLKAFPELLGAKDPVAIAIKTFAKKLSTFPAAIGQWLSGLKTAFNVGKSIGRAIAKLAAPLTVIMSVWDTISGAIDGFTKTEGNIFKKLIGALKGGISGLLGGLVGGIADLLKSLVSWIAGKFGGDIGKSIEKLLDSFSFVDVISKTVSAIVDGGKILFAPLLKFLPVLLQSMAQIGESFSILKFLPKAFNLFKTVIGKIALPLQILLSVFDGVTGFIDGFTKTEGDLLDKIVGGLKGMVSGVVNGLIGGLLDLLKDGASWLARAFGFGPVADALDSFKFTDVITEMISSLFDGIIGFFKDSFAGISSLVTGIKDLISGKIDLFGFVKKALAGAITALLAPFNFISKLAGFNLADKILELLGLPKSTDTGVSADKAAETTATPAPTFSTTQNYLTMAAPAGQRIVSPQSDIATANKVGAEMTAYQNQTNQLNSAVTSAPTLVAPSAAAPAVNSSTVNSVVYNNTNIPDRTQNYMVPAFGY